VSTIALLGVTGHAGRLLAAELAARGHRFVAVGRDGGRIREVVEGSDPPRGKARVEEVRVVDVSDQRSLRRGLAGVDLVLSTVGPYDGLGRAVVEACLAEGTHLIDLAFEPVYHRWLHGRGTAAAAAGVTLVSGAGVYGAVGDLLASLAAGAVEQPTDVHVAYGFEGGLLGAASAGSLRTVATLLGTSSDALVQGVVEAESPGEARRLAWFPRPVGPSHAAGVPGIEPLTVPRHVPTVRTVRTYVAMSSWRAELLQLTANAARWERARREVERRLGRRASAADRGERISGRWACVAEVAGSEGVARAWTAGRDAVRCSAAIAVRFAEEVLAGDIAPGAVVPASVGDPGTVLDALSERTGARWALVRPGAR
jgi:short subunit dehydrogenase-like uncharacterized protein